MITRFLKSHPLMVMLLLAGLILTLATMLAGCANKHVIKHT